MRPTLDFIRGVDVRCANDRFTRVSRARERRLDRPQPDFLTSGELFTFPVALSYISKIAPERLLSAIIGLWFGSSFFGNYFSGLVGSTYPEFATPSAFFAALTALAGAIALVLGFARGPLGRRCPM